MKNLTLTVTIPAKVVPLFVAMTTLHQANMTTRKFTMTGGKRRLASVHTPSMEEIASHGLIRWMVSEESMDAMDKAVNRVLND